MCVERIEMFLNQPFQHNLRKLTMKEFYNGYFMTLVTAFGTTNFFFSVSSTTHIKKIRKTK